MIENKTQMTEGSPRAMILQIDHKKRREDGPVLLEIFTRVTGEAPILWGDNIVGYGIYAYKYATGRTGQWMKVGFSPRKQSLSLYFSCVLEEDELLAQLGKFKRGKGCLYINKLEDISIPILEQIIKKNYDKDRH